MDKNILGASHTILPIILMYHNIFHNVKIRFNPNDHYWIIPFFRNLLEFFSLRLQMCAHLQNNNNQLLRSCTILRNLRFIMLDHCTWNV
jgi:hypothetical protein